jgi:hypothetical protein
MADMDSDGPKPVPVYPGQSFTPPAPLSDAEIELIHAGLAIPSAANIHSMAREIRKWRGVPDPDEI